MTLTHSAQRTLVMFVGCMVLATALLLRAGYVQVINDPRIERLSQRQFKSKVLVRPKRGQIFDRNGEALTINMEVQSLAANPTKLKHKKTLALQLAKALGGSSSQYLKKLNEDREFIWIKRKIADQTVESFKKWDLMNAKGDLVDGFWLIKESQRAYPHGDSALPLLGSVSIDSEGIEGIELWMNSKLEGHPISIAAVKDAFGRPAFMDADAVRSAQEGENIHLTLDASLQFSVEEALKNAVDKHKARGGSVIVMNSVTGEILAMATQSKINSNHRNHVIADGYEPGSTVKPILLAAALLKGRKLTDSVWGGKGFMKVQGKTISEAESHEKFEWISLKKMIQVSSNVGAAKLALEIGADSYLKMLKLFGFGAKTGMGFPGEIAGTIPKSAKEIPPLRLATMAFGHGMMTTSLQVVRAYAAIQNGGFLVKPRLITNDASLDAVSFPRIIQQKSTEKIIETLAAVTHEGSGKKAQVPGLKIVGKTGTSQVVDPKTKKYSKSHFIASFVGFAVGVEPKLTVYTQLDYPEGNYYAAETAAPLFSKVMIAVANRFSMPLDLGREQIKIAKAHPLTEPAFSGTDTSTEVPLFEGLSSQEVLYWAKGKNVRMQMKGFGVVKRQSPAQGSEMKDGSLISIQLGDP
ncbi:MAG: hypothetical protein KA715_02890 [Xanthomonadaceae bacterium]|nr:hypothetical protein [Xanthomonadaceae bacterium]